MSPLLLRYYSAGGYCSNCNNTFSICSGGFVSTVQEDRPRWVTLFYYILFPERRMLMLDLNLNLYSSGEAGIVERNKMSYCLISKIEGNEPRNPWNAG